jgi:peptide/nickel transport system permease protein
LRYILRRLGFFILTIWAALTLNFLLPHLMPGNPAEVMVSKFRGELGPGQLHALEILFGLNTHQNLFQQYIGYLHHFLMCFVLL